MRVMPRRYQNQDDYVPEPLREAGLTYRRMDYWCRRGYLRPIALGGSGNHRKWPQAELDIGVRMAALVRDGYTPAAAARLAREGVAAA